jgi:hypothetical protein
VKTWCYGVSASPPPAPRTTSPAPPTSRTTPPPTGKNSLLVLFVALHMTVTSRLSFRFWGKEKEIKCNRFSRQRCKFMKLIFNSFLHSSFSSHQLILKISCTFLKREKILTSFKRWRDYHQSCSFLSNFHGTFCC